MPYTEAMMGWDDQAEISEGELLDLRRGLAASRREVERLTTILSNTGCVCQSCGGRYTLDVSVSDNLWERIKPEGKPCGGGLLCPQCIANRLQAEVERLTAEWSATDFIGYLIDNCEGDCFLSEELLQQWYADFLKAKRATEVWG